MTAKPARMEHCSQCGNTALEAQVWQRIDTLEVTDSAADGAYCSICEEHDRSCTGQFEECDFCLRTPLAAEVGRPTLVDLIRAEMQTEIAVAQDDTPIRGNVICSDDPDYDRDVEDALIERVDAGDVWGWAVVTVRGRWHGLTASAYLGGCTYKDEAEFRADLYFADMREEVVQDILTQAVEILNASKRVGL